MLHAAGLDFNASRQIRDELDKAVVEKRWPDFDAMYHRKSVDESQHLVRQQGLKIEEERAVEWIAAAAIPESAPDEFLGQTAADRLAHPRRVKLVLLRVVEQEETRAPRRLVAARDQCGQSRHVIVERRQGRRIVAPCGIGGKRRRHAMGEITAEHLVGAVTGKGDI